MIGEATLVPPKTYHPLTPVGPGAYTETPVLGSATAETSPTVRRVQPRSVCHDGFAKMALQPLPVLLHAVSLHPRALLAETRLVPPTAITYGDDAGNSTTYTASPLLAVTATPGMLYLRAYNIASRRLSCPP